MILVATETDALLELEPRTYLEEDEKGSFETVLEGTTNTW